jgi:hypothetical protein
VGALNTIVAPQGKTVGLVRSGLELTPFGLNFLGVAHAGYNLLRVKVFRPPDKSSEQITAARVPSLTGRTENIIRTARKLNKAATEHRIVDRRAEGPGWAIVPRAVAALSHKQ